MTDTVRRTFFAVAEGIHGVFPGATATYDPIFPGNGSWWVAFDVGYLPEPWRGQVSLEWSPSRKQIGVYLPCVDSETMFASPDRVYDPADAGGILGAILAVL